MCDLCIFTLPGDLEQIMKLGCVSYMKFILQIYATFNSCIFSGETISLFDLQTCFRENPCLTGLLAFNPKNPELFILNKNDKNAINNSIVSCVSSEKNLNSIDLTNYCNIGEVPIYNKKNGLVECYYTGND